MHIRIHTYNQTKRRILQLPCLRREHLHMYVCVSYTYTPKHWQSRTCLRRTSFTCLDFASGCSLQNSAIDTYAHTHIRTYINIYTYTYIHTYTCTQMKSSYEAEVSELKAKVSSAEAQIQELKDKEQNLLQQVSVHICMRRCI